MFASVSIIVALMVQTSNGMQEINVKAPLVPQFIIIMTFIVGVSSKNLEKVTRANVEQFGLKRSPLKGVILNTNAFINLSKLLKASKRE